MVAESFLAVFSVLENLKENIWVSASTAVNF